MNITVIYCKELKIYIEWIYLFIYFSFMGI
uniref:Uncharacterized protein n=1 Tax=Anguilla anguilla TaxID=7936 RepID=A0A0E9R3I3_ANGAN